MTMSAVIKSQHIGDEEAIDLGYAVLIASKSEPGAWYAVQDGACQCKGYQYRGTCRHLAVARQAQEQDDAPPERGPREDRLAPRTPCRDCGSTFFPLRAGRCPTCFVSMY
jgi:hypothetical protein